MTALEQLIYDFCKKNHTFTLLDTDEAMAYTEEKAKELAKLVDGYFNPNKCADKLGNKIIFVPKDFFK